MMATIHRPTPHVEFCSLLEQTKFVRCDTVRRATFVSCIHKQRRIMNDLKVGVSSLAAGDLGDLLMSAGSSGVLGVAIGAVLKRAMRLLAVVVGLVAILLQVLVYMDFIEVHWQNVEKKAIPYLDANQDGVVNDGDVQQIVDMGIEIFTQGLPNVAGFMTGVMVAFRFL